MRKDFCDRCGTEVTNVQTGAIHGIEDADQDGNGNNTHNHDAVCMPCYKAWLTWMKTPEPSATKKT